MTEEQIQCVKDGLSRQKLYIALGCIESLEKENEELKEENEHIRRLLGIAIIVLNRIENPEVPYEKVVDNLRKLKELLGSIE